LGNTSNSSSGKYKFVSLCEINLQGKKAWLVDPENICDDPYNSDNV
jgi:hypothetical protein